MAERFNTLYKAFRNRLRPYRAQALVRAAVQTMHRALGDRPEDLQHAPWQVMLLVKWALQDPMVSDRAGRDISSQAFDQLRQHLYELTDQIGPIEGISPPLFVRRLIHQQVAFQRKLSAAFVREAALLLTLESAHPLRQLFQQRVGLSPELFIDLSLATYSIIAQGRLAVYQSTYQSLRDHYGAESVNRFLALVSRDFEGLHAFCQQLPGAGRPVASEMLELTPIRRVPFLREGERYVCWHPMVFYRGMEDFVHLTLSEAGSEYMEPFSKLFERHVRNEVVATARPVLMEKELADMVPDGTRVPDALVMYSQANIFIEAKSGLFDDSMMVVGDKRILSHKTRALRYAFDQGWDTAVALRHSDEAPASVTQATTNYLIVVTNRELGTSNGVRLRDMYPEGKLDYPNDEARQCLPLGHIYVVSIDDFERLVSAVKHDDLDLPALLARCAERDLSHVTGRFYFDQHLAAEKVRYGRSELLVDAIEQASKRVESAL